MGDWRKWMAGEEGVVLPLAFILLLVLTMLAVGFMSLGALEPQISANLSDTARARQAAEAGIEWAFQNVAAADWSALLAAGPNVTPLPPGCAAYPCPMPGLTAGSGTFTVTVRNDVNAGDGALTGYQVGGVASLDTTGTATSDGNGIIILTSTGTFNGASRTITTVLRRGNLPLPGAANLPGVQADTYVSPNATAPYGNVQTIDGRDWKRTDPYTGSPTGTGPTKLAMAVQPGFQSNLVGTTYEANAENGFNNADKRAILQGATQSTAETNTTVANRISTLGPDSRLTPAVMQDFLNSLAANPATQILQSTQGCPMVMTGNAANPNNPMLANGVCGMNQAINLGTPSSPKLIYVRGDWDPTSLFAGMTLNGQIQGAGILVIEDGDLNVNTSGSLPGALSYANFYWDGIVIITGRNVGVGFRSNSKVDIRGALIANETNAGEVGGFFEFLNQSQRLNVRNSKQNIDMALGAAYNTRISVWRDN